MFKLTGKPIALICAALLCSLALMSTHTSAAQLYRYKDDQGNYVLNQTIPPKYVKKGYEILNSQGRVIQVVDPELSPEQISARDAALEIDRLRKLEAQKQALIDNELKQLYSHPNDAVHVLSRRVQDIKSLILVKQNKIETSKKTILEEEAKAAKRQRQGLKILEATIKALDKQKVDIANNQHSIIELRNELNKLRDDFDKKIRRLEVITGKDASDYSKLINELENKAKVQSIDNDLGDSEDNGSSS